MPSLVTNLVAVGLVTVIATEKPNARKKITALAIDNAAGGGARVVQVQDRFTPSITNAVPVPAVQTPSRFLVTIGAGNVWNFDEVELRNVEVLGQLELTIDVADAGCIVSIAWEHK
ncbi:hypothetical protein ES703_00338 [subsurface metagenome]